MALNPLILVENSAKLMLLCHYVCINFLLQIQLDEVTLWTNSRCSGKSL